MWTLEDVIISWAIRKHVKDCTKFCRQHEQLHTSSLLGKLCFGCPACNTSLFMESAVQETQGSEGF